MRVYKNMHSLFQTTKEGRNAGREDRCLILALILHQPMEVGKEETSV